LAKAIVTSIRGFRDEMRANREWTCNALVPIKGTVLYDMLAGTPAAGIDEIEFVRTIAVARITMPQSMVHLSAGRESMSVVIQALAFIAGANSIFTGTKLLTSAGAGIGTGAKLFWR
jgi:biotin synthase